MNKKILGIILTISMLVSLIIMPNTAQAAIGIDHEAEVSKLNAFGILSGYPDASYNASAQVTAKEFIDAAYKVADKGNAAQYDTVAANFGVKYDDKTITAQSAGAILLTLLNYNFEAEAKGGYPSGYNSVIANYKLLDGANQAMDAPLTNDTMAVMLYNSLELYAVTVGSSAYGQPAPNRTGRTVMQELDIYEGRGVVTGTEFAAMNGSRTGGGNSIVIDNTRVLLTGRTYADNLLGYSVEYYYSLTESTLLWIEPRDSNVVTQIAEADIHSINASGITFDNDKGRSRSYSFRNPIFVYNGKQVTNPDFDMFIPKAGYVITVDNDGDNRPEVVMCESYEYFLVGAKNPSDGFINDYETSRAVSLSENDYDSLKIIKNGMQVSFDDLAENDIVALMRSDTTNGIATAVISPYAPVSGTVTAVSSEDITIDGERYKVSTAYEGAALELKASGTFYRDLNGNIVRYTKGTVRTAQYAYLIHAYVDDGGSDVFARILTAGGAIETHKLRSRVSCNGETVSANQAYNSLVKDGQIERQLITYGLNTDGEINSLDTADTNNLYSGRDEPSSEFSIYSQGHGRYRNNNHSFNSKYLIEADTPIFVVPASREMNDYSVHNASSLTNGTSYYISVYDIDEYMTAGAIVLDELESDPQMLKSARSILVTGISRGFDEAEGDDVTIVEGYQQGSEVTLYAKDGDAIKDSEGNLYSIGQISGYKEIGKGDVIQASLDANGRLLGFRVMYKADETRKKLVIAPNDSPNEYEEGGNADEFSDLFVLCGTVKSRSSGVLVVESDTKRAHRITSGVSVYVVKNNKIEKVTTGDIYVGDEVYLHTYQGNIQEIVIYR